MLRERNASHLMPSKSDLDSPSIGASARALPPPELAGTGFISGLSLVPGRASDPLVGISRSDAFRAADRGNSLAVENGHGIGRIPGKGGTTKWGLSLPRGPKSGSSDGIGRTATNHASWIDSVPGIATRPGDCLRSPRICRPAPRRPVR